MKRVVLAWLKAHCPDAKDASVATYDPWGGSDEVIEILPGWPPKQAKRIRHLVHDLLHEKPISDGPDAEYARKWVGRLYTPAERKRLGITV